MVIDFHHGRLHAHLQLSVLRLDEEHAVHDLERGLGQVQLLRLGQVSLARKYDESNRQRGCHRRKYAVQSH